MMAAGAQAEHDHESHLSMMPVDANGNATTATHVAVNDGDWFDPATWAGGQVPDDGALVHVPAEVSVTYEGVSDAHLFMMRVDGNLTFTARNGVETRMVVDTMLTSSTSKLVVDARAADAGTVDIEFAEGAPAAHAHIYTDFIPGNGVNGRYQWDPDQLSLGLVASGMVDVKGQEVEASAQLATGPSAGDTQIVLNMDLAESGWAPGQQIVVGGVTFTDRNADGTVTTEDEVRTITDIQMVEGKMVVNLDEPLAYDHAGPTDPTTGLELTGFVGNMSRNVTFSSAVADQDGDGVPDHGVSLGDVKGPGEHYVTERGHIMFMHNDDVTVHDIAVKGLGRTDKSINVDDVVTTNPHDSPIIVNGGDPNAYEEGVDFALQTPDGQVGNPRGRYALHIHMANSKGDHQGHAVDGGVLGPCPETGGPICHCGDQDADGIADCRDDDVFDGAWIEGVAVWGSPGWGIVQHSSDAVLKGNVIYDVAGSAFVSETGDETGRWTENLAIGTYGARDLTDNQDSESFNGDGGGSGNGFYMKSRALEVSGNVAQSSARAGFMWHTEGGDVLNPDADKLGEFGLTANHTDTIRAERVVISGFEDNTVIAAKQGIRIIANPEDSIRKYNDVYSHMKDFKGWEIDAEGVSVTYSSKYIFEDFLLLGTAEKISADAQKTNAGFYFKASVADVTVVNSHVEQFTNALTNWTQIGNRQEIRRAYWDPKFPAKNPYVEFSTGMGEVDGIDSVVHNLWNTNIIGLTHDNLGGGSIRVPAITVQLPDGTEVRERGYKQWDSVEDAGPTQGVEIELLGDSRDGGLVALWREHYANHPDQNAMLTNYLPLAYQNKLYLGQYVQDNGGDGKSIIRWNYRDYVEGINDDIWSGTVLEFAKTDSLGRHVFNYNDFAPLNPAAGSRTVTTNEKLVFSKEEVDATLVEEGYYSVRGVEDVKFVKMREQFSDRLTGETRTVEILVALDLAWQMPAGTKDNGLLIFTDDMIIAPQYRVFLNGVLVEGREAIKLAPPESTLTDADGLFGVPSEAGASGPPNVEAPEDGNLYAPAPPESTDTDADGPVGAERPREESTDGQGVLFGGEPDAPPPATPDPLMSGYLLGESLYGGAGADQLQGGDGDDVAYGGGGDDVIGGGCGGDTLEGGDGHDRISGGRGFDTLDGGQGNDVLAGDKGNDWMFGGSGVDVLNGGGRADRMYGGDDRDMMFGEAGSDQMWGDAGDDFMFGQTGRDRLFGGSGDDLLNGGANDDRLFGGDGADRLAGGQGRDRLRGGEDADAFIFEAGAGNDMIDDFEDGVDAIEFMVSSFGFDDLEILRDGDDTLIRHGEGEIRLFYEDPDNITAADITFISSG